MRKLLVVVCLGFSALIGLSSMEPVAVCQGCEATPGYAGGGTPQLGWDLEIMQAVTSGICTEAPSGTCAAQSCVSTVLVSGYGPFNATFSGCYQTTGSQKYCVSPAPVTDQHGNVNYTSSKRYGCGNEIDWEFSGPNGESKVTANARCSKCE